jgi:DNA-directed RNA polymerase sigma subunit (sigma70/sigma32)
MTVQTLENVRAEADLLANIRAEERNARIRLANAIRKARAEGHSLADIAKVLGISRQRVMQISR